MTPPPAARVWLLPLAVVVIALDVVALAVKPPHLRHRPLPKAMLSFEEELPTVKKHAADTARVEALLASLSLEEKVGQLLVIGGLDGPSQPAMDLIQTHHIGNVLVDADTADTTGELAQSIALYQQQALASNQGVPMLVVAEAHTGTGEPPLTDGLVRIPGPSELGELATPEEIERAYGYLGSEFDALGINSVLGPLLDLGGVEQNPLVQEGLIFSRHAGAVRKAGIAAVAGLQNGGIATAVGHFPGQGPASVDATRSLPEVPYSLTDLEGEDLAPFKAAVREEVAMVQVGNLYFPLIQGERSHPAWQSQHMVSGLLRTQLQYQGVVITADLNDPVTRQRGDLTDQAMRALAAGCDLILYSGGAEGASRLAIGLTEAARSGDLSPAVLDAAVGRVLRLKTAYELFERAATPPTYLAQSEFPDLLVHKKNIGILYERMETRANPNQVRQVTPGMPTAQPLVLPEHARILVAHVDRADFPARYRGQTIGQLVQERYPGAVDLPLTLSPDRKSGELAELGELAEMADVIIVGTWKQVGPGQRQLFEAVRRARKPIFVVSRFISESDNTEMPDGTVQYYWIANNTPSMTAALQTLFGVALRIPGDQLQVTDDPAGGATARPMPEDSGYDPVAEGDAPAEGENID